MEFTRLTGKNKVVYESIWGGDGLSSTNIEPNAVKGATTYKIVGTSDNVCEVIEEYYNISNKELFGYKYKKAVSGNGDEEKKILTLHSSSRCALLCFYNVEEKPITLNIAGKDIEFNYSTFEFKNPVIGYPSNMDVVLLSTDRKTVLFLESKFAEYYLSASEKSQFISESYLKNEYSGPIYDRIEEVGLSKVNKDELNGNEEKSFCLCSDNGKKNYTDGIKQMISHYVGIRRRLNNDKLKADKDEENIAITYEVLNTLRKEDSKVYLGEILFDGIYLPKGCNADNPQEILKEYSETYEKLAKLLNEDIQSKGCGDKFIVLENDMKYTEVMKNNKKQIDKRVLEFYGIKE